MSPLNELGPGLNAWTVAFDVSLLEALRASWTSEVAPAMDPAWLEGAREVGMEVGAGQHRYRITSFGHHPLLWVSCNDEPTYGIFRQFFDSLGIEDGVRQVVDCARGVRVYCGFFVVGDHAEDAAWHMDYEFGANGLTLLTPLFDPDPGHGGLLYYDRDSAVSRYPYRSGEAILFGAGFYHATEPYERGASTRILLSLTLGTDRMKYWPQLEKTVGTQSNFLILPSGHVRGSGDHAPASL